VDAAVDASNSVPYQPFGMIPKTTLGAVAPPDKAETVAVWFIAVMPLVMVGVAVLAVTQLPDYYTRFMQGGLLFIVALVSIALAVRDSRELRMAGHLSPASPAWILLTPLGYLIARSVRVHKETGHGSAPLWGWLVIVAAVTAAAVLLPEWLSRIVTATSLF
jgi:tellurite resistance protein TehA-like permease